MYPVGSYYETSNTSFNPNTAWGGTWAREDDGTVLVSKKSSGTFNKDIGTIVGEETHTLTTNEMPSHTHEGLTWAGQDSITLNGGSATGYNLSFSGGLTTSDKNNIHTKAKGGSQAHNNVQPSKVVYRWHRTA